jgi:hypothetical protein
MSPKPMFLLFEEITAFQRVDFVDDCDDLLSTILGRDAQMLDRRELTTP